MNSKQKGTISEYKIISKLLEFGFSVSIPIGDNNRYDLIIDYNGSLFRCQCKTAHYTNGGFTFNANSTRINSKEYISSDYIDDVEFFIAYYPDKELYIFYPCIDHTSSIRIRTEPTKNQQSKNVNFYEDYKLEGFAFYVDNSSE